MTHDDDILNARPAGDGGRRAAVPAATSADESDPRATALRTVQAALIKEIDGSVNKLERARIGESTREHLEILRGLLKAQVNAYLDHFVSRRATLFSHTSVMYAGEMGEPGVISTTLRGLLEGNTLTGGQGRKLAQFVGDRRTLLIFGDRATGKSTLLNALFELVPLDDRFVAIERGPDLPALKERSFCVRLSAEDGADVGALFAKARRMAPGRLVIGEIHGDEVREFFAMLADDPRIGGMATLRADSIGKAVDAVVTGLGGEPGHARELVAAVRPVFAHMHSDEKGSPRLAAVWNVEGLRGGELVLEEVRTTTPAATQLVAEA